MLNCNDELTAEELDRATQMAKATHFHDRQKGLFVELINAGKSHTEAIEAVGRINKSDPAPNELVEEAILLIKQQKEANRKVAEYWQKVKGSSEPISILKLQLRNATLKKMMQESRINPLVENIHMVYLDQCKHVFDFMLNHCMGETEDSYKGTLFIGGVGVGKSTIHKAFSVNPKMCYQVVECKQVADEYMEYGPSVIRKYSTLHKPEIPHFFLNQPKIGWCFNDLGWEDTVKHYGNPKEIMEDIIAAIYEQPTRWHGFHFNSNKTPDQLEAKYGERTRSRLRAICHVETFEASAKDLRK